MSISFRLSHCPLMSLHVCDNLIAQRADRTFAVLNVMCTQHLPRGFIAIYVENHGSGKH